MNAMRVAGLRLFRAEATPAEGCVYFVQNTADGLIKIGCTANLPVRFAELQRATSDTLRVLHVIRDRGFHLEGALHGWFVGSRRHGEWFSPTNDLLAYIEDRIREDGPLHGVATAAPAVAIRISPDALRTRRVHAGLTLTSLAGKAGLSVASLSRLESGKGRGSPESWTALAGALDCDVSSLLIGGADESSAA